MKNHPVPQNIMDVEFKLFGELTIRQFAYIVGGLLIGAAAFAVFGFSDFLRWPIAAFFVIMGIMLALFKINDRPFEVFLANFLYAIINEQRMIWKKELHIPQVLQNKVTKTTSKNATIVSKTPLEDIYRAQSKAVKTEIDKEEEERLLQISELFNTVGNVKKESAEVAEFDKSEVVGRSSIQEVITPSLSVAKTIKKLVPIFVISASKLTQRISQNKKLAETISAKESYLPVSGKMSDFSSPTSKSAQIPIARKEIVNEIKPASSTLNSEATKQSDEDHIQLTSMLNVISAVVKDGNGNLLRDVSVMVKNESGQMLRYVKTNMLGQFIVPTSLPNGKYYVELSKIGYTFERIEVILDSEVLDTLDIRSN